MPPITVVVDWDIFTERERERERERDRERERERFHEKPSIHSHWHKVLSSFDANGPLLPQIP